MAKNVQQYQDRHGNRIEAVRVTRKLINNPNTSPVPDWAKAQIVDGSFRDVYSTPIRNCTLLTGDYIWRDAKTGRVDLAVAEWFECKHQKISQKV